MDQAQPVKLSIILIGIFLILVAGAGGVYLGKYLYAPKIPAATKEAPIETLSVTPTTDPMADWKIYQNPDLGVEFKYPQIGWFVTKYDSSGAIRVQNFDPQTAPGRAFDPNTDKGLFGFVVARYRVDNSIKNFLTVAELKEFMSLEDAKECFYYGDSMGVRVVTSEEQSQINTSALYSRQSRCSKAPDSALTIENFLLSGKGDVITVNPMLDVDSGQTIFPQILSTFKFNN